MITNDTARQLLAYTLQVATSMTTSASTGVSCDYNTFYVEDDDTGESIVIDQHQDPDSVEIIANAKWQSTRELYCSDGERLSDTARYNIRISIKLCAHEFAETEKNNCDSQLVYLGKAGKENDHLAWEIITGLYKFSHLRGAYTAGVNADLGALVARFPYWLWRVL